METFFSGNGYEIVDQRQYEPGEITFANIWGVCDEDAYRKVIRTLNEDAQSGKPFFAHVMTVSNHRPYTYPAGRIPIPNDAKLRSGGVMYTDYALDASSKRPAANPGSPTRFSSLRPTIAPRVPAKPKSRWRNTTFPP